MESELSVRDVLTTDFVGVSESDTVRGAVGLMRKERASCVLVVRGSEPVGIMTEWDVLGVIDEGVDPNETTVGDVMTSPVITVGPDQSLADVATMMARQRIRNLVVETPDRLLGLVTQRDVIAAAGSFHGAMAASGSNDAGEPAEYGRSHDELTTSVAPNGADEFATQGVCEACGSLADQLWETNGRLVCPDCRSV